MNVSECGISVTDVRNNLCLDQNAKLKKERYVWRILDGRVVIVKAFLLETLSANMINR